MIALRQLQQQFMSHLLGQPSGIDSQIQSTPMMSAKDRLHIYANAYRMRLKEALATDYDKLHAYLGDAQFDQLMNIYIDNYPSNTTSLRYFSTMLPTMLQQQVPYKDYPEIYELALIEQVFANSFDADNSDVINLADFASVPEQAWPSLQFSFQPSLQLVNCDSNAFAIWKALSAEEIPPEKQLKSQHWVVWRRSDLITHYRPLEEAEYLAMDSAMSGATFAALCEQLLAFYSKQETPMQAVGFLQSWVQEEMLAGLNFDEL